MSEQEKSIWSSKLFTILVLLIIAALLVLISIPSFIGGGHGSPANACLNNLRQLDAAANQFALENHKTNGEAIHFPNDLTPYIKLNSAGKIPPCPSGGIYLVGRVGKNPTCSLGTTVIPPHVLP